MSSKDDSIPVGGFVNCAEALATKHADTFRLLVVDGNTMFDLLVYEIQTVTMDFIFQLLSRQKR